VVDPGPVLAERIGERIDAMLDHGWLDEVRELMQTVPAHAPAWNATGYDAMRRLVQGELTRAQARERVLIDTRQYAKRQRTWFRHQLPDAAVTRVDPTAANWQELVLGWAA
jgi:tRNA dimethylallyltransferase